MARRRSISRSRRRSSTGSGVRAFGEVESLIEACETERDVGALLTAFLSVERAEVFGARCPESGRNALHLVLSNHAFVAPHASSSTSTMIDRIVTMLQLVLYADHSAYFAKDMLGHIPLETYVLNADFSSHGAVRILQELVSLSPRDRIMQGNALHMLCSNPTVSPMALRVVVEHIPRALAAEDELERQPLHLLCDNRNVSAGAIDALLMLNGRGGTAAVGGGGAGGGRKKKGATQTLPLAQTTRLGETALHTLCRNPAANNARGAAIVALLRASGSHAPLAVLQQNNAGETPLAILCQQPTIDVDALSALIDAAPSASGALKVKTRILHETFAHSLLKCCTSLTNRLIERFMQSFAGAELIRDGMGLTPMHHFCASPALSGRPDLVMNMIALSSVTNPKLMSSPAFDGQTPLHALLGNPAISGSIIWALYIALTAEGRTAARECVIYIDSTEARSKEDNSLTFFFFLFFLTVTLPSHACRYRQHAQGFDSCDRSEDSAVSRILLDVGVHSFGQKPSDAPLLGVLPSEEEKEVAEKEMLRRRNKRRVLTAPEEIPAPILSPTTAAVRTLGRAMRRTEKKERDDGFPSAAAMDKQLVLCLPVMTLRSTGEKKDSRGRTPLRVLLISTIARIAHYASFSSAPGSLIQQMPRQDTDRYLIAIRVALLFTPLEVVQHECEHLALNEKCHDGEVTYAEVRASLETGRKPAASQTAVRKKNVAMDDAAGAHVIFKRGVQQRWRKRIRAILQHHIDLVLLGRDPLAMLRIRGGSGMGVAQREATRLSAPTPSRRESLTSRRTPRTPKTPTSRMFLF